MSSADAGRIVGIASLFLLLVSSLVAGDVRERLSQETGLDVDLISLIQVDVGGTELTVVFVFIDERAFESRMSARLREILTPYAGRNAVYVNPSVKPVVSQFEFEPLRTSVQQGGGSVVSPGPEAWVEITPGFLEGRFEVNPIGADQGSGSEGILVLGAEVDPSRPFDLIYAGERAGFVISPPAARSTPVSTSPPTAASPSHPRIDVPALEDVSTLQDVLAHDAFSAEAMAALLGLDPSLIRTMDLEVHGEELRLLFVRLEPEIRGSALGDELLVALDSLIGSGAVMVWAFSSTGAEVSPWYFWIQQLGTNYVFFSSASFVELTEGFVHVERIEEGDVVAGVIRLPKGVDPAFPFAVFYRSTGVSFP
jgi:hypothetical protein